VSYYRSCRRKRCSFWVFLFGRFDFLFDFVVLVILSTITEEGFTKLFCSSAVAGLGNHTLLFQQSASVTPHVAQNYMHTSSGRRIWMHEWTIDRTNESHKANRWLIEWMIEYMQRQMCRCRLLRPCCFRQRAPDILESSRRYRDRRGPRYLHTIELVVVSTCDNAYIYGTHALTTWSFDRSTWVVCMTYDMTHSVLVNLMSASRCRLTSGDRDGVTSASTGNRQVGLHIDHWSAIHDRSI